MLIDYKYVDILKIFEKVFAKVFTKVFKYINVLSIYIHL